MTRYGFRLMLERNAHRLTRVMGVGVILLVVVVGVGLFVKARPILGDQSLGDLLFSSTWRPLKGDFGLLPFIAGTLWVTGVALVIAVPLSLMTAIYLSEYASQRTRNVIAPFIDLLSGIPSVVFGVWGVLVIVPFIKDRLAPAFGVFSSGYCVLAGGMVLAVMILPVIIHVSVEILRTVPVELRWASWSVGASKWQTIRRVVLRKALPGIIAANVLGLSRAFGETMAVLMVAGNGAQIPRGVLDPAQPLPALIANNFGEMMSIPRYDAALMFTALILFAIVVLFNAASRAVLVRIERRVQ